MSYTIKLILFIIGRESTRRQRASLHSFLPKSSWYDFFTEISVLTVCNFLLKAAKVIRHKVALAGIAEVIGSTGDKNVQGETVQILDRLANEIMIKRLLNSGVVCMVVSEEDEEPLYCPVSIFIHTRYLAIFTILFYSLSLRKLQIMLLLLILLMAHPTLLAISLLVPFLEFGRETQPPKNTLAQNFSKAVKWCD